MKTFRLALIVIVCGCSGGAAQTAIYLRRGLQIVCATADAFYPVKDAGVESDGGTP